MKLDPPPYGRLAEIFEEISEPARDAIAAHLLGGTSANWLARTLRDHGHPIGATALKDYRATLKQRSPQEGV